MGQRLSATDAAEKDAQIMLSEEGCALDMGKRLSPKYAAEKNAQILSRKEEWARGRKSTDTNAVRMGAQTMSSKVECAGGMGQRLSTTDAAEKDAQIMLSEEGCA